MALDIAHFFLLHARRTHERRQGHVPNTMPTHVDSGRLTQTHVDSRRLTQQMVSLLQAHKYMTSILPRLTVTHGDGIRALC